MRPLEITLLAVDALVLLLLLLPRRLRATWMDCTPGIAELLIPIQIIFEGYRWQMLPMCDFTGLLFVMMLPRLLHASVSRGEISRRRRIAGIVAVVSGPLLFPAPRLP